MKEIVFASGNPGKVKEVGGNFGKTIRVIGLKDILCTSDLPETSDTFRGNAHQKAKYVWEHFRRDCFADDTGLEVEALNGRPGVFSARYAGEGKNNTANIEKLLAEMKNQQNRRAQFRTVICCIVGGKEYFFEGIAAGHISKELRGSAGFGYDPVFIPDGNSHSFAEMSTEEKNRFSHRGKAIEQLKKFLLSQY
ncbi:MAG: RdgB/HAM1 family non-canonical purine NTP pyrophosphatase [Crocinitomicaceae bacterium]|nr:RdgB/HAM1 family non-canonical purine NTP pyrophosphatase [Crocinitomicaceae bacterium]